MPAVPVLREVAEVDEKAVLDMWGGYLGDLDALYLATGTRVHGGESLIFRHAADDPDDVWTLEETPPAIPYPGGRPRAETMNKIRDDGGHLYCFYESDGKYLVSRPIEGGPGSWSYEPLPGPRFVGGRGLYIDGDGNITCGGSANWQETNNGQKHTGHHGSYSLAHEITPGILWEIEADGAGNIWEFWHEVGGVGPHTFRNGSSIASPPTHNTPCAGGFGDTIYITGDQLSPTSAIRRWSGSGWETVHSFPGGANGDHIFQIPRDPPELWAIGQDRFEVEWSLDGEVWETVAVPDINTGHDTNQLTAIAFFQGRVWVAASDGDLGKIRVFTDRGAGRDDLLIQVI